MRRKYIIFYPYGGINSYVENMKRCWGRLYQVIPMSSAENNFFVLRQTRAIILNWYEGCLDAGKKRNLMLYKFFGIKIIWVFHNRIPHASVGDTAAITAAKENMRFLARISDAVIIHSRHSKTYLKEYTDRPDKIFYVPHVNYRKQYKWAYEKETKEEECVFRFVFQGAVAPYKNMELLIRVFKELNMPHCQLHIVGKPCSEEYARKIRKLSEGAAIRTRFEYLSNSDVGMEIRSGDVVILPYDLRSSMNSGAMLTAFTNRRTVIISENAMAQDYRNKDFLYVYHYAAEKEHYQKLKSVMWQAYCNGKKINREMGERAYEYTEKHNSDEVVIHGIMDILNSI